MVVRPVQVHQLRAEALQEGQGHGRVVDEGLAAAGRLDCPAQDQQAILARVEAGLGQEGVDELGVGQPERGLDRALGLAGADGAGVGALAKQEVKRADQDGFARAGLPRDDVEAGLEIHRGLFDEGEVLDSQQRQHGRQDSRRPGRGKARSFRPAQPEKIQPGCDSAVASRAPGT